MARPTLVPFKANHLLSFIHRDGDYTESVRGAYTKERNPAWTAVHDGEMLGCAGVVIAWPGFGVAWACFADELFKRWPVWTTRTVRRALADIMRAHALRRVEAVAIPTRSCWLEALGFHLENGRARSYTVDGRDVVRYERIL